MGKHHKANAGKIARVAIVPSAAAAVIVAASGTAQAAPNQLPSQGGVTSAPETQGGVTSAPSTQGGVTSVPEQPEPLYWVEPPAQYQNIEYQPLENYDYETNTYDAPDDYQVAPIQIQELHLPTQVEPTAPIIAPRDTLRLGTHHASQPNWVTDGDLARTNNTSAVIEAEVSNFWRSVGVETSRADRVAAGGLGGATAGAVAFGTGFALAGAAVGGAATLGNPVGIAAGAAIAGIPAALAFGAVGASVGTAVGAGDLGEPKDLAIPDIDKPGIQEWTEETLAQWDAIPGLNLAASAARGIVAIAPEVDRQARDLVASVPGGDQFLEDVDERLETFYTESSVGLASQMISDAVGTGTQA
ncbi:hypothetical protein [Rhodococcus spongiicola]|uniref:Insoluble domain protein n=1 Tax=Rhodococcus spongiicola TaxID=2487352 RepID=A0A438B6P2_9NOCA|nr:hypothetical protein [Rhodococcus spongiicola]RVW06582.1 hypothetical protein EF834_04045 [Rhodococcus spongiicola]